jgi:hypothetical protein
VVVTVPSVRVVKVSTDQVVRVVTVRHGFVSAAGTMRVGLVVSAARVARGARRGVLPADAQGVLVGVVAVDGVKMALVQVVGVPVVLDGGVTAAGTVGVRMLVVRRMAHRGDLFFFRTGGVTESSS